MFSEVFLEVAVEAFLADWVALGVGVVAEVEVVAEVGDRRSPSCLSCA
ncbi:MAG: hypothetical protein HC857_00155 [Synechococcales cyanobacterium RU_4_20]|nr:hypothetical protein [Synechococcales cyanobacterium RU_4_20]